MEADVRHAEIHAEELKFAYNNAAVTPAHVMKADTNNPVPLVL